MKNLVGIRLRDTALAFLLAALAVSAQSSAQTARPTSPVPTAADEMAGMHAQAPKVRSTTLTVTLGGKTLSLSSADLAAMPHETVEVVNGHTKAAETYSGVPVAALLDKLGLSFTKANEHTLLRTILIAEGTDGYRVILSTYETLAPIRGKSAIIADAVGGKPLEKDGAFKLVVPGDTRPQRWVQNLKSLTFKTIE